MGSGTEEGMQLKKRLIAAAAVAACAAAVLYGSTLETNNMEESEGLLSIFDHTETIYFWYNDESMTNFINSAAVTFGEEENVRVIPVLASESEYLEAINDASVHTEQTPDAYIISHDSLEKAYLSGLAERIQDEQRICSEAMFPASALSAVAYQGRQVAYPLFFETSALVYNETYLEEWAAQIAMKELLEGGELGENPEETDGISVDEELLAQRTESYFAGAIPSTVEDILNIANTFDLPQGVEGVLKWDVSDIFYNYWIVGNYMVVGGDAGDDSTIININNPETIQCLEVYKALNQFFYIEPELVTYESVISDFCEGRIVFTIATTDVVSRLEAAKADGSLGFEYGIARLPRVSGELDSRTMSVTNVVAINGYSRHQDLANRFATYLVTECADSLYEKAGKVPAKLDSDAGNGALQIFKAEYAESIPLPKLMETGNFWVQLEGLFSKVWNGADVTALVQELADQITMQINAAEQ